MKSRIFMWKKANWKGRQNFPLNFLPNWNPTLAARVECECVIEMELHLLLKFSLSFQVQNHHKFFISIVEIFFLRITKLHQKAKTNRLLLILCNYNRKRCLFLFNDLGNEPNGFSLTIGNWEECKLERRKKNPECLSMPRKNSLRSCAQSKC